MKINHSNIVGNFSAVLNTTTDTHVHMKLEAILESRTMVRCIWLLIEATMQSVATFLTRVCLIMADCYCYKWIPLIPLPIEKLVEPVSIWAKQQIDVTLEVSLLPHLTYVATYFWPYDKLFDTVSWTAIVVHNRDRLKISSKSLIERTQYALKPT